MSIPVRFRDEAINEGVATATLRGKDLSAEDVRAIVNAVLVMQQALSPKIPRAQPCLWQWSVTRPNGPSPHASQDAPDGGAG